MFQQEYFHIIQWFFKKWNLRLSFVQLDKEVNKIREKYQKKMQAFLNNLFYLNYSRHNNLNKNAN